MPTDPKLVVDACEEGLVKADNVEDLGSSSAQSQRRSRLRPWVLAVAITFLVSTLIFIGVSSATSAGETTGLDAIQHMESESEASSERRAQVDPVTPSGLMQCDGAVLTTEFLARNQYKRIVRAIHTGLDSLNSTCGPTFCPQADITGCILRICGHDFMDYNAETGLGGTDGCLDMTHPDNAGLPGCLYSGEEFGFSLNGVYQQWCDTVSLADFIVIGAEAVIDYTRRVYQQAVPEAGRINFRNRFRYGRTTVTSCEYSYHRLPNPEVCSDVQRVFVDNLGLDWTEAAALMGVHTLGRASPSNSGYDGWWSDPENSRRFNNNFFISILANGWMPQRAVGGNPAKNQWERSNRNFDPTTQGKQMMLDTDLCLAFSTGLLSFESLAARDHDCCAWTMPWYLVTEDIDVIDVHNAGEFCDVDDKGRVDFWKTLPVGIDNADRLRLWDEWQQRTGVRAIRTFIDQRQDCCKDIRIFADEFENFTDCGSVSHPTGLAFEAVQAFSVDEDFWVASFLTAWRKATRAGHRGLKRLERG